MRVLCVAEKPSAAKKIAEILSQRQYDTRNTQDQHVKNYSFTYNLNNRPTQFTMTALKGHLFETRFEGPINRDWNSFALEDLFHAPITKIVPENSRNLADNIKQQVMRADVLFIWTDCDREGEAIGGDLADLCRQTKPNIPVWRARFSAMQDAEIHHAAQNHAELDMKQVEAVRARSELDLRIGAAFTRLQTINLRSYFVSSDGSKVISYGSCQFPTLGFVVDRYLQVENFIPEQFWKINMTYVQEGAQNKLKTTFNWRREHLFDRWACFILYEKCFEKKVATVTKVKSKQTSKWKPLPLTTVEMQKVACRVLNMSGNHIMTLAEGLYTQGLISYPRTETDQFDAQFDFMTLINMQTQDPQWGEYAQLIRDGEFQRPRNGKNNDKAHPPIHPTGYDQRLSGDAKRLYEFIVRRFLASCWKNAIGHETTVEVKMDTEYFDTKGLVILERNYLEVYPYDKWSGNEIPEFQEGHEFVPDTLEMMSGQTSPPRLLTETDLISMMEKNEIGTDATIAEHIQKILDREYVYKENQYFKPLTLGIALIKGYDQIGFESSLSKPFLRRQMEADLKSICQGTIQPNEVLRRSVYRYKEMFMQLQMDFTRIRSSMDAHYREVEDRLHRSHRTGGSGPFNTPQNTTSNRGRGGSGRARGSGTRGRGTRGRGGRKNASNGFPAQPPRDQAPLCSHGKPKVRRTVQKAGPNKGREFYVCGESDQCENSFEFIDGPTTITTTNNSTSVPPCQCNKPSVKRTVTSQTENHGRPFYTCAAGRDQGCRFFEWAD